MLTMAQIYDIRKFYFVEGKNLSQISCETGYDRKTIRRSFIPKKKGICRCSTLRVKHRLILGMHSFMKMAYFMTENILQNRD